LSCSREPRSRPYADIEAEQQAQLAAEQESGASAIETDLSQIPPEDRDVEARRRLALLEQAMAASDVSVDGAPGASGDSPNPWITPAPETTLAEATPEPPPAPEPAPETPTPTEQTAQPQATIIADAPADTTISQADQLRLAADPVLSTLRSELATSDSPIDPLLQLAAMESIVADALPADQISGDKAVRSLTPDEIRLVQAWRELHAGAREEVSAGDVASLSRLLTKAADEVRGIQPLTIAKAALCTRVERFGVYDELPTYANDVHKMVAGRPQRVLLYLELENFSDRPDSQGEIPGTSIDLTVGLTLHHLGRQTDLLAWKMSDETVHVFSRNQRREFFLSIVADLPPSISVDSYVLKATVKDENSSATAERVIRIDMVADESALVSADH